MLGQFDGSIHEISSNITMFLVFPHSQPCVQPATTAAVCLRATGACDAASKIQNSNIMWLTDTTQVRF